MLANENSKNLDYDIVIIGAGPAGIILSLQFNKTDLKVALVESGEGIIQKIHNNIIREV